MDNPVMTQPDRAALADQLEYVCRDVFANVCWRNKDVLVAALRADNGLRECTRPHLGLATTRELLNELSARFEMHVSGGLDYRTVDGETMANALAATKDKP